MLYFERFLDYFSNISFIKSCNDFSKKAGTFETRPFRNISLQNFDCFFSVAQSTDFMKSN